MNKIDREYVWNPWQVLSSANVNQKYAVIVLNRPIMLPFKSSFVLNLWKNARVRITVDGGTDRWLQWLRCNKVEADAEPPELVTGDMDSITEKSLQYFRAHQKTKVIVTEDQNETDFTKALKELKNYMIENSLEVQHVVVLSDISGRFDQLLSNVNTLFKAIGILPFSNVYILASDSLTWLLTPGSHMIGIPMNLRKNSEWCSLVPVGSPCQVTTSGLKWNLNKSVLEFGNMVSTSNTYSGEAEVVVFTDSPVLWSMGINKFSAEY